MDKTILKSQFAKILRDKIEKQFNEQDLTPIILHSIETKDDYENGPPIEYDPNGVANGTPGAKLDAGKIPVVRGAMHYFPKAITAVAELSSIGARKYSWKGWESVPDGINRYADAMGRHELAIQDDYTRRDPDTGVLEATAVAWNALARLELILRGK